MPTFANTTPRLEYILAGIHDLGLCLFEGDTFRSVAATPAGIPFGRARRWKTRRGLERFIAREKAAGSNWQYVILTAPVLPEPEIIQRKLPDWHCGTADDHAARPVTAP